MKLFFVYFLGTIFGKIFFLVGVFSDRRVDLDIAGCVRSFPHVFRKKSGYCKIFLDFEWILGGFWWILGGFLSCFSTLGEFCWISVDFA